MRVKYKAVLPIAVTALFCLVIIVGAVVVIISNKSDKKSVTTGSGTQSTSVLPSDIETQIKAAYPEPLYLPTFLPQGYNYSSWKLEDASASTYFPTLNITFGNNGNLLVWEIFDSNDGQSPNNSCITSGYASQLTISGQQIYYAHGNHGSSAWRCPTSSTSTKLSQGISIWFDSNNSSYDDYLRMIATAKTHQ